MTWWALAAERRRPLEHRHRRAPRAAKALLHLLELLWGDAHQPHSASRRLAAKAENRAAPGRGGFSRYDLTGRVSEPHYQGLVVEIRSPKSEGRRKAEIRRPKRPTPRVGPVPFGRLGWRAGSMPVSLQPCSRADVVSAFGFRPSFGLRVSGFGFVPPRHGSPSQPHPPRDSGQEASPVLPSVPVGRRTRLPAGCGAPRRGRRGADWL